MKKTKTKGFTLVELLVAMIVSSLLIASGYGLTDMVRQQLGEYKVAADTISSVVAARTFLQKDAFVCRQMKPGEINHVLFYGTDTVAWQFEPSFCVRSVKDHTDTFIFGTASCILYCKGNLISETGTADEMQLTCTINGNRQSIHLYKVYSASQEMQAQTEEPWP